MSAHGTRAQSAGMPLVGIAGDGTFAPAPGEGRLEALTRLRALLGDDLEEQIATELFLPAALGTESADQLLPASLALLAGATGDLTSYGWRVGPGAGHAWRRAQELRARTTEDARFALLGYEGPLVLTTFGPVSLAAATFLASGERTLADRGALRDLPVLLAEGVAEQLARVAAIVPGARPRLLLREDAVRAVHQGLVPTPSGYRRYPALPAPEIGGLWRSFLEALDAAWPAPEPTGPARVRFLLPALAEPLEAARTAGARSLAVPPQEIGPLAGGAGRRLWEGLAQAREEGVELAAVVDPARVEPALDLLGESFRRLGYADRELTGMTLLAHRPLRREEDPGAEPSRSSLLTEPDLVRVLRVAPAWAERVQG
ncbi:hypothetical protein [Brachybacterium hainanense]|uniref:Methionine synthase n=1 Tax=Brachybacterium hainanense TaxID=1541174 RepID=A0ABV6R8T4_9MICO